jgi:hypothetical protein
MKKEEEEIVEAKTIAKLSSRTVDYSFRIVDERNHKCHPHSIIYYAYCFKRV